MLGIEVVTLDYPLDTLILFLFIQIDSAPNPQVTLKEFDFNIFHNSYADFNQIFVTDFDDCSYNDLWLYNSKNFFDFSVDLGQPMPLN